MTHTVAVSGEDYQACVVASMNMWGNTKPGTYGKGLTNLPNDPYRVSRVGRLGEMGFARLLGTYPDLEYKKGGDDSDFTYKGLTIDTKTAFSNYGFALVYAENESGRLIPLKSDIYVFGFLKFEFRTTNRAEITYVGYASKELILAQPIVPARRGTHKNYELPYKKLFPLSGLIE